MARKNRNGRRHNRSKRNGKRQRKRSESPASWKWHILVILLALLGFGAFIMSEFEPIDQLCMAGFSFLCAGLGLLMIGSFTACGEGLPQLIEGSRFEKAFESLARFVIQRARSPLFRLVAKPLSTVFTLALLIVAIPTGVIVAIARPKQTWPSIVYIGGTVLSFLVGILILSIAA